MSGGVWVDLQNDLNDEDIWWLRLRTAPIDLRALADGRLSLEEWRRQRIDVRPRWRRMLSIGYVMQGRWK